MIRILGALLFMSISMWTGACATTLTAERAPNVDLAKLHSFYVRKLPADNRGIEALIAQRLSVLGYASTSGVETDAPSGVDVLVTYEDRWMWDLTMYMLRLDVVFRDPRTQAVLVSGQTHRTSLARASPEKMVQEVLDKMLERTPTAEAATAAP